MNVERSGRPRLAASVSGKVADLWRAFMLRGLFAAVLGIWPGVSLDILLRLLGLYCVADGVAGLLAAWRAGERGPNLLQALLGILVGAVLLFWPGDSIRILLVLFGAWVLLTGISQIGAGRRLEAEGGKRNTMTAIGGLTAALGLVLIVWPGTGVVTIAWVIGIAALLLAALLIWLALGLKRLQDRMASLGRERG